MAAATATTTAFRSTRDVPVVIDEDATHVVQLKVIGLTGIAVETASFVDTTNNSNDGVIISATTPTNTITPSPTKMVAQVAVMRDSQTYGTTIPSRPLVRAGGGGNDDTTNSTSKILTKNNNNNNNNRYIAVWNGSSRTTECLAFETNLPNKKSRGMPHKNFELIVGLKNGRAATTSTTKAAAAPAASPIGAASLPIVEAAQMCAMDGKVVLDLPVFNFATLSMNPFVTHTTNATTTASTSSTTTTALKDTIAMKKSPRRKFYSSNNKNVDNQKSSSRRNHHEEVVIPATPPPKYDQEQKKKELGYNYYMDPGSEVSFLRVEVAVHAKEMNVETGVAEHRTNKTRVVLLHSQQHAIETAHTIESSADSVQDILFMEPSIERVLSSEENDIVGKNKNNKTVKADKHIDDENSFHEEKKQDDSGATESNKTLPAFKVTVVDQNTMDYEFSPVGPITLQKENRNQYRTYMEAEIERVLSKLDIDENDYLNNEKQDDDDDGTGSNKSKENNPSQHSSSKSEQQQVKTPPPPSKEEDKTEKKQRRASRFKLLKRRRDKHKKQKEAIATTDPIQKKSVSTPEVQDKSKVQHVMPLSTSNISEKSNESRSTAAAAAAAITTTSDRPQLQQRNFIQKLTRTRSSVSKASRDKSTSSAARNTPKLITKTTRNTSGSERSSDSSQEATAKQRPIVRPPTPVPPPPPPPPPPLDDFNPTKIDDFADFGLSSDSNNPFKESHSFNKKMSTPKRKNKDFTSTPDVTATTTTPESIASVYSESLPKFEKGSISTNGNDDSVNEIIQPVLRNTENVKSSTRSTRSSTRTSTRSLNHVKKNLVADLSMCGGGGGGNMQELVEDDNSVAESNTLNENSTLHTVFSKKDSLVDDLADLGLLLSELCRPMQMSGREIDFSDEDDETLSRNERAKSAAIANLSWNKKDSPKPRWMMELGASVMKPHNEEEHSSAIETSSGASVSEGASYTETTGTDDHDCTTSVYSSSYGSGELSGGSGSCTTDESEQGTEVDVHEAKRIMEAISRAAVVEAPVVKQAVETSPPVKQSIEATVKQEEIPPIPDKIKTTTKLRRRKRRVKARIMEKSKGDIEDVVSNILENSQKNGKDTSSESNTNSTATNEQVSDINEEDFHNIDDDNKNNNNKTTIEQQGRDIVNEAERRNARSTTPRRNPTPPKLPIPPTGHSATPPRLPMQPSSSASCSKTPSNEASRHKNSSKDDQSPRTVINTNPGESPPSEKTFAQSLVEMVTHVISPVPEEKPFQMPSPKAQKSTIPSVPSVLEAHDDVSVGDLTATTHELQVEIEEFKRKIGQREFELESAKRRTAQQQEHYFAEYDQCSIQSPELVAATDAAKAKKMSEEC